MALAQNPAPSADLFDSYFRRADLDRDGRISGLEAVTFFQASGLPNPVLAKIWDYADQNRIGFLGRAEFYNALKLVTVAQSKRELTPEIVKAALFGPAAAKIPPPQINLAALAQPNLAASPATQSNPSGLVGPARVGAVAPLPSQSVGYRPQVPSIPNVNQQHLPNQESHLVRPPVIPQTMSASSSQQPTHGILLPGFSGAGAVRGPNSSNASISADGMAGRTVGPSETISQVSSRGVGPLLSSGGSDLASAGPRAALPPRPNAASGMMPPKPPVKDPKQLHVSGNGFSPGSNFGGDLFSATPSQPRQQSPTVSAPVSAAVSSLSPGYQPPVRTTPLDSSFSSFSMQPGAGQLQPVQGLPNQKVSATNPTASPSVNSRIPENSSQIPWPKMTQADVQKYSKVFVEVDKDKDGKITGIEARKLFLSWRLPIDILKQVWDLSDQDNDSMLSHREFCIALYLMERYREGRTLPSVLPSNIILDFPTGNQPAPGYGGGAWGPPHGFQQKPMMPVSSSAQTIPPARGRPPLPPGGPPADGDNVNQKKSKVPVLEKKLVDQLSTEEQNSLNSRFKEAMEADKKVEELEKEILESKEKIEFYRVKMQELVMYKSRCDNRLNEIMERVSGDKREVETLSKKYEDKYKQTGDVASKLTIEEATFRDIQEKKMELYRAIVGMEQGDGADFKARAEKIQFELDELVKALNERCKSYGLRAKPITLLELPFAWQPGIQGTAADWDEDWDKFEDEGFTFVKELTLDVQNVIAPPKEKTPPPKIEEVSKVRSPKAPTSPHTDEKTDKPSSSDEQAVENGVHHDQSDAGTPKSAPGTPAARSTFGSPGDAQDSTFAKMSPDAPVSFDKEKYSDHEVAESEAWGTMDNDDVDSVWGFNGPTSVAKESNYRLDDDLLFGSGLSVRTGISSPRGGGFQKRSTFFDESVPSTPLNSVFSPSYKEVGPSSLFDSSSRFDSFNLHDTGVFPQRDLSRFDSMRSSKDFDASHGGFSQGPTLSRFDSMASSKDFDLRSHGGFSQGPTLSRFDSMASSKDFDLGGGRHTLSRFDSMRSSKDVDVGGHGFPSFDDSDPFGSTSFRPSLDGQPSRRASDSWGETPRQGGFDNTWGETPKHSGFDTAFGETPKHSGFDTAFGETPKHSSFDNVWGAETPRQGFNNWGETPRRGGSGFGNWGETPKRSSDSNWGETPKASFDNWGETPRKDASDKSWSAF